GMITDTASSVWTLWRDSFVIVPTPRRRICKISKLTSAHNRSRDSRYPLMRPGKFPNKSSVEYAARHGSMAQNIFVNDWVQQSTLHSNRPSPAEANWSRSLGFLSGWHPRTATLIKKLTML